MLTGGLGQGPRTMGCLRLHQVGQPLPSNHDLHVRQIFAAHLSVVHGKKKPGVNMDDRLAHVKILVDACFSHHQVSTPRSLSCSCPRGGAILLVVPSSLRAWGALLMQSDSPDCHHQEEDDLIFVPDRASLEPPAWAVWC